MYEHKRLSTDTIPSRLLVERIIGPGISDLVVYVGAACVDKICEALALAFAAGRESKAQEIRNVLDVKGRDETW